MSKRFWVVVWASAYDLENVFTVNSLETFCRLSLDDCQDVAALEQLCFSKAWTQKQFAKAFRQPAFSAFGIRNDGMLVAYVTIFHVVDELEIVNIATHSSHRRNGHAYKLLSLVLQVAAQMGIKKIFLEVRPSNTPAIALYERLGFICVDARKGYYQDTGENALIYSHTM